MRTNLSRKFDGRLFWTTRGGQCRPADASAPNFLDRLSIGTYHLSQDRSDRLPWIEHCTVTDIAFYALCIDVDNSFRKFLKQNHQTFYFCYQRSSQKNTN